MLLLLNSACFFLTDNKKAGVPYLRELFIVAVFASAMLLLLVWRRAQQSRASGWILFFGLLLPVLSAVLAAVNFGQPLTFGLLEERRSLLYLIFFPALFLMIKARPTQEQLGNYMLWAGLACVVVGYLYYFGLLPENSDVSFTVDEKSSGDNPLRPNRFSIGAPYVSACAFLLMYRLRRKTSVAAVLALVVFAAYLWLVIQTRNIMLIWVLAGMWIFRSRLDMLFKLAVCAMLVLLAAYFIVPDFFAEQLEKFNALIFEATSEGGVRSTTISIILHEVPDNGFIGLGALSLQWQGGFSRLYNSFFYLSDVGIIGVYYRYGLFTPIIVLVYYLGYLRIIRQCQVKGDLLCAFQLDFFFNCINFFLSSSIMYGGETSGLAIAAFVYFARESVVAKAAVTPPSGSGYPLPQTGH
jgi:hypothetical protein